MAKKKEKDPISKLYDALQPTGIVSRMEQKPPEPVDGLSAYELACEAGFMGTEQEWLITLVGAQGEQGPQGEPGKDGKDGVDGKDGKDGISGRDGVDGKDGKDGIPGRDGVDGKDGRDGLRGDRGLKGDTGEEGLSAYEVALANGFIGSEQAWLESLKGKSVTRGLVGGGQGPAGPGVAAGGTTGQVLQKLSNADYDTGWTAPGGGAGFTQEEIEDFVGAMVSGNTELGIDVTYDDAGGKLNFDAQTAGDLRYAPMAKGVTNGDAHDHNGGDGAQIAYGNLSGLPTLGTAAAKNIPAAGDASPTEVVYGTDSRLTNARTPTAHVHPESDVTNLVTDLANKQATLVSGTNIKTINGASVLGSGDLVVSGSTPEIVQTRRTITADTVIGANYSAYVSGGFEIPAGFSLEISGNASFEIG